MRCPKCFLKAAGALLSICIVSLLGGCATATNSQAMVAQSSDGVYFETIQGSLSVLVVGGKQTSSISTSQISNADFKSAITDSIKKTKLFSSVIENASESNYILRSIIVDLEQPSFGFSMTVNLEVAWSLTRSGEKAPIWKDTHISTYTASYSEAFAGVTRLRVATEKAAKRNIGWALETISNLGDL